MIKYTCEVLFCDPFDEVFNHKEIVEMIIPESTYSVVKDKCFKVLSNKVLDIPREYVSINFSIIGEDRL